MSFLSIQFFGQSIGKQTGMHVILPPGKGPFPAMYLLHGLSDDYTIWSRRTSIERYVAELNMIVVMPDGGRSFYCNDSRPGGMAYENHIVKDVVGFIDTSFRTIAEPNARAVAGLSMGGYGAFMLAIRHIDVFSVACSHSGAMGFMQRAWPDRSDIQTIAGTLPQDGRYDLLKLAQELSTSRPRPALYFDCGTDDGLLEDNRMFQSFLKKLGIKHEYREYPGAHSWDYWDTHIQQSIAFILSHLKDKKIIRVNSRTKATAGRYRRGGLRF